MIQLTTFYCRSQNYTLATIKKYSCAQLCLKTAGNAPIFTLTNVKWQKYKPVDEESVPNSQTDIITQLRSCQTADKPKTHFKTLAYQL